MQRVCPLTLLLACHAAPNARPCLSFAETVIVDEAGDAAAAEQAREALADFAAWTTRDGACVTEIVVTEDVPFGAAGMLDDGRILVFPQDWPFTRETTLHELCHAADGAAGSPSHARGDLFDPDTVPTSELYPTVEARTEEAYARVCEDGAEAVAEKELVAALCGDPPVLGDDGAWVREHVYDAFVDDLGAEVAFAPMTVTRARLWDEWSLTSAAVAGNALAFLDVEWNDMGAAGVARLRLVDPVTQMVTELPVPEEADPDNVGLLSTDGDPILWSAQPPLAWRIDPDSGGATPLSLSGLGSSVFLQGFVHGDTAWLVSYGPLGSGKPLTVDLATGGTATLTAADGAEIEGEASIFGNGDRVALSIDGEVDIWSFAESAWTVATPATILDDYHVPLADGALATRYTFRRGADTLHMPALVDPETLVVTFPSDACDTIRWGGGFPLLPVGDVVYAVVMGEDGSSTDLVRVEP